MLSGCVNAILAVILCAHRRVPFLRDSLYLESTVILHKILQVFGTHTVCYHESTTDFQLSDV